MAGTLISITLLTYKFCCLNMLNLCLCYFLLSLFKEGFLGRKVFNNRASRDLGYYDPCRGSEALVHSSLANWPGELWNWWLSIMVAFEFVLITYHSLLDSYIAIISFRKSSSYRKTRENVQTNLHSSMK